MYYELNENNVRLRGKKDNIIDFLTNELVAIVKEPINDPEREIPMPHAEGERRPVIVKDNWGRQGVLISKDPDTYDWLYFNNSNNQFIVFEDGSEEYGSTFTKGRTRNEDTIFILCGYQYYYDIPDVIYFENAAKHYRIDIRIFLWNSVAGTSNIETFYRNGTRESHKVTYSDWMWESPMPEAIW